MTVAEIYRELDTKIPRELSCEWDNDGLMCCPEADREVKKVLVALDVTGEVADAAIDGNYDLILSHHPFIFKGLKNICDENYISGKAIKLIRQGVSVMSFHTRLDALCGGVNDTLAARLGLSDVMAFGEEGIGRIGVLSEETPLSELATRIKYALGAEGVLISDAGLACRRVAVLGGEGGDDIRAAMAAGADTFVSGRLGYHSMVDAPDMGINLIEAGHFYTENPVCAVLRDLLLGIDGGIKCDIFYSNRIKLI